MRHHEVAIMPLTRKRPEDKSQRLQPRRSVRLYLDETDEVLGVMQKFGDVRADTNDFVGVVDQASDLKAAGTKVLRSLTLHVEGDGTRSMTVELGQPVGVTITPSDDLELAGAAQAVRSTIAACQTKLGGISRNADDPERAQQRVALFAVPGVLAIVSGLILTLDPENRAENGGLLWTMLGVSLGLLFIAILVALLGANPSPSGTVLLAYRSEAPTWWQRNGTAVVLGLITNGVVGAAFFILGLWLGGD
jgi:hypothetical protein